MSPAAFLRQLGDAGVLLPPPPPPQQQHGEVLREAEQQPAGLERLSRAVVRGAVARLLAKSPPPAPPGLSYAQYIAALLLVASLASPARRALHDRAAAHGGTAWRDEPESVARPLFHSRLEPLAEAVEWAAAATAAGSAAETASGLSAAAAAAAVARADGPPERDDGGEGSAGTPPAAAPVRPLSRRAVVAMEDLLGQPPDTPLTDAQLMRPGPAGNDFDDGDREGAPALRPFPSLSDPGAGAAADHPRPAGGVRRGRGLSPSPPQSTGNSLPIPSASSAPLLAALPQRPAVAAIPVAPLLSRPLQAPAPAAPAAADDPFSPSSPPFSDGTATTAGLPHRVRPLLRPKLPEPLQPLGGAASDTAPAAAAATAAGGAGVGAAAALAATPAPAHRSGFAAHAPPSVHQQPQQQQYRPGLSATPPPGGGGGAASPAESPLLQQQHPSRRASLPHVGFSAPAGRSSLGPLVASGGAGLARPLPLNGPLALAMSVPPVLPPAALRALAGASGRALDAPGVRAVLGRDMRALAAIFAHYANARVSRAPAALAAAASPRTSAGFAVPAATQQQLLLQQQGGGGSSSDSVWGGSSSGGGSNLSAVPGPAGTGNASEAQVR